MAVTRLLRAALLLAVFGSPLAAQTGTITGRVTDSTTSAGLYQAIVEATQGATVIGSALTSEDGSYRIASLPAGTYALQARLVGFRPKRAANVRVATGTTTQDFALVPNAQNLQVVTTVSRRPEKVQDAPANISVVETREIGERPNVTAADHLKGVSGVDATQGGIAQSNVVTRGFNNAFSGSLLVLQDYRFAGVPSLRVNVPLLFTGTNEDISRMEILLGPASALYGPNSANGVLHIITKSPFESQGTTVTIDGGEQSIFRGSLRHAGATTSERFGYKFSAEYFTGKDWRYDDPAEPDVFPAAAPPGRRGQPNVRDFDVQRATGEARIDMRPTDNTEFITTYGFTNVGSGTELTGSQGTAQVKGWTYQNIQQRMRWKNLFVQGFINFSDAGNKDSTDLDGTYLLRGGQPIVDKSRVFAAQIQHAFDLGVRNSFVYGADYIKTNPRTGNTINGRNEDIDDVQEVGGYAQYTGRLNPRFDFITALRVDNHDVLDETYWSPRVALVFKPRPEHALRATYNHAFSTPANFSFFLDLPQGVIPIPGTAGYTIRGMGVPTTGWNYSRSCTTGIGGLCMRSPFPQIGPTGQPVAAPNASVDANASLYYRTLVGGNQTAFVNALLAAGVSPQNVATVFGALFGTAPAATNISVLRQFVPPSGGNPAGFIPVDESSVTDLSKLKATISDVFEVGYKGVLGSTSLAIDGWYETRKNFTTASTNTTPNVFFNPTTLGAHIGAVLAGQAQAGRVPAAAVQALATAFTTSLAGVPLGTVVPDSPLAQTPDLFFTYKNIDESINVFGFDFSIDHPLNDMFSVAATYSFVSEREFPEILVGGQPLSLNAPNHKASLTGRVNSVARGMRFEVRGRYTNAFPVVSGVYVGEVPVGAFVDLMYSWRPAFAADKLTWSIIANNVLDNQRPTFIGVPDIGRLVMSRLSYTF